MSTTDQLPNTTNYTKVTAKENVSSNDENSSYQSNEKKEIRHLEENGMRIYLYNNQTNQ